MFKRLFKKLNKRESASIHAVDLYPGQIIPSRVPIYPSQDEMAQLINISFSLCELNDANSIIANLNVEGVDYEVTVNFNVKKVDL